MTRLSVIICTHNPLADYLQRVLHALAAQTLPPSQWSLLLIDNASDSPLAGRCDLSWHPNARIVREDRLGLTSARLRGIEESDGDALLYVDDDNLLAPDYLQTAQDLLRAHPLLGAIGAGTLTPEFAVEPSPELRPHVALLALRSHARAIWGHDPADQSSVPWGAGLCVRREVTRAYVQLVVRLDAHQLLDRRGQHLFGNGDVAFSWAASLVGQGFGVFPELRATHLIRAERITRQYFLRMVFDSTFSNTVSDYLFLGVEPGSAAVRWQQLLRLPLRAVRRGPFAMQMAWAAIRGADRARELIERHQLKPLARERASPPPLPAARRAALDHLAALLRLTPKPAWATPLLIALGLATSLAETLGITLIVAFLYSALGQTGDAAAAVGGLLGQALERARAVFGSPVPMALGILALILARAGLSYANRAVSAAIGERISEATRNRLHQQYLSAPYAFMQRHEQAQLMEVLGTESWLVAGAYRSLTRILVGACQVAVFAAFLLALSWPITLMALAGSVVLSLVLHRLARPAQALGQRVKQVHQKLGEHMLMTIEGLRTIRAYGQEAAHHERFVRSSAEARATSLALTRLSSLLDPITEVGYLVMLCLIVVAALQSGTGLATLLAAVALLYRLQPHAREIEGHLLTLAQIEPQLRSVRAMLHSGEASPVSPGHVPVQALRQGIRFEGVRFAYADGLPPALDGVSFDIPAGRTTALVGASGAGKTTLIHLLLRLYTPGAGTIRVDGVPLQDLRRADWLGLLAVAGQDVDLIEGTVADNIRMADAAASHDDVLAAARLAGVDEFVTPLAEGYDTWIGQQGHRFSGGQRQRLGLARALLRKPQLLILDEALNALDSALERRIRQAIAGHLSASTVLIISHHADTVRHADHVVHLQAGRIVAEPSRPS